MGVFRFKRFEVRNDLAAQKVGTDAVLLGAAMTLPIAPPHTTNVQQEHRDISAAPGDLGAEPPQTTNVQHLLDIGTGTGVIALMAAQRLADLAAAGVPETVASPQAAVSPETAGTRAHFQILAIDIDPAAISEATANFASSPWSTFLKADEISLNDLDKKPSLVEPAARFSAIFSNPPYFEDSLKAPDARRSTARHTDTLSYREICAFAARHLTPGGTLSLVLPSAEEQPLIRYAASFGLKAFRILRIRTTARKPFSRIIAEFRNADGILRVAQNDSGAQNDSLCRFEELILMDGTDRSSAYAALTKDFYL